MTNDGAAHVVEYYYDAVKLRRADGKPLAEIVRSIKQALYSGEFTDTTGLAERQEVNADDVVRYNKVYHGSGADAKITDHVRFFRTADGEAYGFTMGGKIYIDPRIADSETPIHEYAHLWATALRNGNAEEWKNVVELMKDTKVWDEVRKRYPELETDDEVADEVLAAYSGRRGAERLREEMRKAADGNGSVMDKAEAVGALEGVREALKRFWKGVADFLHIHYTSAEEVADRVMKDLLDGVDPRGVGVDEKVRKQFIGERGAEKADHAEEVNTRLDNLRMAREMEDSGKDAKAIKMVTGWERGADGKWRYEIPDIKYHPKGDAEYNKLRDKQPWSKELDALADRLFDGEQLTNDEMARFDALAKEDNKFRADFLSREKNRLADWVENKELFAAYPELKNVEIVFTDQLPENEGGYYSAKENRLVVNTASMMDTESVIGHEVQHAIQRIEGFARGGNMENVEREFRKAKAEWVARAYAHELEETAKELGEDYNQAAVEKALIKEYEDMDMADWLPDLETRIKGFNYFARGYADRSMDDAIKRFRLDESVRADFSPYLEYRKLAGEVEARNVQSRMGMTSEERRASLAAETEDVAREDQIFLNGSDGVDAMGSRVDKKMEEIGRFYEEKGLSDEERAIVDVFSGKKKRQTVSFTEKESTERKMIFSQGHELKAGSKHAIFRHLNDKSSRITIGDIAKIHNVLNVGERVERKGKVTYSLETTDGVKYTLASELDKRGNETFVSFYTNRKASTPSSQNTQLSAQAHDADASLGAKVKRNSESGKESDENVSHDEDMYRIVDDEATIDRLEREPKMKAYRAIQVIDGRLYSPMAAKVDGKLTADNPVGAWTEAEETVFDFTPEQKAAMEKLDNSEKKGDVEIIKGKLRYHKESEGGRGTLQFHLVKGDGTSLWAAYNPYIHSSLMMLNDQFTSAYKRPNIVVVEVEIPKSELTSGYRAERAKDPVGMAEWKAGPVAGQLPSDMGRKVMLSRWSKVKRIVPYAEVADHVASILEAAEAKNSERLTLPIDSFHPELRKELEKRGFKFEYGQYTKEKTDKNGNVQTAWDEKSDAEKRKAYKGASYMDDAAINELNEELGGKWLKREGDGAYTDEELSWANDPVSKMLGRSRWSKRQQGEFAARERERMASRVEELADKLHLNNVEVVTDASMLEGRRKRAKGFYNKRSGKITIVIPNHASMADVEQTLLHEAVAHYGLRELFGEQFDTFLDNVYSHAELPIRKQIAELARKNGWDFRKATEEYLANLAESTDFEGMNKGRDFYGWWSFVKRAFLDMLYKIGFGEYDGPELSDNELRYILWRSYENLKEPGRYRSVLGEAADMSKQMDLKVGNFAEREELPMDKASEVDMFRDGDNVDYEKAQARNRYDERVSRGLYQMQEALQDSMLGLKEAMDAILGAEGKKLYIEDVAGYENAYLGENRLSSVNQAECNAFARTLFKPLLEEVARLAKTADERAELTDYMMAKHGLERNEVMARRAAEKNAKEEFKAELRKAERAAAKDPLDQDAQDALDDVKQRQHDREEELYFENRGRDYSGLTALTGMDNVVDAEAEAQRMVSDYESSHDTADLWDRVNNVTNATLSKTYESRLISKATYDDIRTMYKHYIPLRGFDEKTSGEAYAYLQDSHSAFNTPIKTARGRKSKADDPFANMESMAESAIMQGNRNVLVKQKFLNFALNHPSDLVSVSDLWLRYDDAADEWKPVNTGDVAGTERLEETDSPAEVERKMQDFEDAMEQLAAQEPDKWKKQKDNPDVPYRVVGEQDLREHQVLVKRDGKDYLLTINGNPRAAQALNGQTNPDNRMEGAFKCARGLPPI